MDGVGKEGAGGTLWCCWGLERGIAGGGENVARRRRSTMAEVLEYCDTVNEELKKFGAAVNGEWRRRNDARG